LASVIAKSSKYIKRLVINCSWCSTLTDVSLNYLSESIKGLTRLQTINILFSRYKFQIPLANIISIAAINSLAKASAASTKPFKISHLYKASASTFLDETTRRIMNGIV